PHEQVDGSRPNQSIWKRAVGTVPTGRPFRLIAHVRPTRRTGLMRVISALFDTYEEASSAVRSLKDAGIPSEQISLVANNSAGKIRDHEHSETDAGKGAGLGAATGAGVGLLAGLGALAIPGIGPVVAGGWLLTTAV